MLCFVLSDNSGSNTTRDGQDKRAGMSAGQCSCRVPGPDLCSEATTEG